MKRQFTADDKKTLNSMIQTCRRDFPMHIFVGVDPSFRPTVVAVFENWKGDRDFGFWHFSSRQTTFSAFCRLKNFLAERLAEIAREGGADPNAAIPF